MATVMSELVKLSDNIDGRTNTNKMFMICANASVHCLRYALTYQFDQDSDHNRDCHSRLQLTCPPNYSHWASSIWRWAMSNCSPFTVL